MRVSLLCAGSRFYGMEMMAYAVARGLRDRGHDVRVVASTWSDGEFVRRLKDANLRHELIPLGKVSKSLDRRAVAWTIDALRHLPQARKQLRRHFSELKPDVVLVYNRDWALLAKGLLRGQRTILQLHELTAPSRSTRLIYSWIDASVLGYVAASEFIADQFTRLGIQPKPMVVIHNGIDDQVQQTSKATGGSLVLGIVGQVGEWKGHDDFVAALALLRDAGHDFAAVIFGLGEPSYVNKLKAQIENLGLTRRIRWLGYVHDRDDIYSQIDVCVVPSRNDEAFGLVAAEAGLRRVPVVATRRGALPEIVLDEETGFLVDSENPGQLAARIADLLKSAPLRKQMGEHARERCQTLFGLPRMVDEMERVCRHASIGGSVIQELPFGD